MNYIDRNEQEDLENFESQEEEEIQGWQIDDIESANWALRKVSQLEKKRKEIEKLAQEEIKRIEEWKMKENKKIESSLDYFNWKLQDYLMVLRAEDPKAKISTPYGAVSTRIIKEKFIYDHQIVEELKEKGLEQYIRITEEVNRADLKKVLTLLPDGRIVNENGEVMKHIVVEPAHEKIIVRTVD